MMVACSGGCLDQPRGEFSFLEHHLARHAGPWLERVRGEGGRIVIAEIPPLHAPGDYHPQVEDVVRRILGANALETLA